MDIITVPAGADNYMYIIQVGSLAAVVDPVEPDPIWAEITQRQLSLRYILVTHHHADHIMGVPALAATSGARVLAPESHRIPAVNECVGQGDEYELGNARIHVLDTPGHGDLDRSYRVTCADQPDALFCGDTLFVSGCGRILEGTAEQLWESLRQLKQLPDPTRVYCGHEYTEENLRFACSMFPEDDAYRKRAGRVQTIRTANGCTVPSTIGTEKKANPFLRASSFSEFCHLRRQKDRF